jgi:hypothetical protein
MQLLFPDANVMPSANRWSPFFGFVTGLVGHAVAQSEFDNQ